MSANRLRLASIVISLAACGGGDDDDGALTAQMVAGYGDIAHTSYSDSLAAAEELDQQVRALVATASPEALEAAREAWYASREPYLQTEVYRFYDGPIDNPDDGPEGLINAWPLDEAYIDYVEGDLTAGIVNDTSVTIDGPALEGLNEQGGEANIATGYHAVEFLLWGQDRTDDGPGDRPHTDYVDGGSAANQGRRADYLTTASGLIVEHLGDMVAAWAPGGGNYRAEIEAADPEEGMRRILTGMIVLTGFETGGERLQTALDSGDQEDEHSCFSDNTHRDMVQDIQGIHNVWTGSYRRVRGPGMRDVVATRDADLAAAIDAAVDECLALANALQPPFDQEIAIANTAGRERVQALVVGLRALEGQFEEVFRLFELEIPQPE